MHRQLWFIVPLALLCCCTLATAPGKSFALAPEEVMVLANTRVAGSVELARYYMAKRRIPDNHLLALSISDSEHCSRAVYEREIRDPVRAALARLGPGRRIRCLLVVYGVPLAIDSPRHSAATARQLLHLQQRLTALEELRAKASAQESVAIERELAEVAAWRSQLEKREARAAVDSELALVLAGDYPLEGWLANPNFLGLAEEKSRFSRNSVLMVSRLDGPSPELVRRLIDDTLAAENEGLTGGACIDARWPKPKAEGLSGYAFYDAALHRLAEGVSGRMTVRRNSDSTLFQPGDCPDTALYSGWYSLGRYIPAFTWARGAVGYHIASAECSTLRRAESEVWCKRLLEEGVVATVGPVFEPYVQAFPPPDLFFLTLLDGFSLAESYLVSLPHLSWQMVLVGDPLYRPFPPLKRAHQAEAAAGGGPAVFANPAGK